MLRVLHTVDGWHKGGLAELVIYLAKFSQHSHSTWGYNSTMTPWMKEAGIINWEGGPPEEEHFDVVVAHTVGGWSHENLSKWAHDRNTKIVEICHSVASSPTPPQFLDGFIGISNMVLDRNKDKPNGIRIYGICDVDSFSQRRGSLIGRLSRLADEKRPQDFLVIANCFREEKFVIAGDGPLYQSIKEQSPINLTMAGWVRDFPSFYSSLKLFAFPTRDEACCMSVAMAQAAGLPCIVQDIPQMRETTGGHALFANNVPEFVSQVKKFLDNPQEYDLMAKSGHEWAKENFDVSATVPAWDGYLEGIAA